MSIERARYFGYLQQSALFHGLDSAALEDVASAAQIRRIRNKAYIFYQDEPAISLYLLVEGQVKFTQVTADGRQVLLRVAGPGEIFGTVAALGDALHPATAQASGDCVALAWRDEVVAGLVGRYPGIALNVARFLAGRLREFQDRYRELATERVERRVAHTLLRLSRLSDRAGEGGLPVDLHLTRQDIAEMAGTTLFTVSRILQGWQQREIVRVGRERVAVCKPYELLAIAEDTPAPT